MAYKSPAQLFGDDAAHGKRVPIDTNPASGAGLGADNRAIALGEELTSRAANRITYALALNDDDLNVRITAFEAGGLDGVYRLGAVNQPGGGRTIHPDGGAVETAYALATPYASDPANAHWRANMALDTADGATGFEAVSRVELGGDPGAALFGFLDRRALELNSSRTHFAAEQAATLNGDNAAPDGIQLMNGGFFRAGDGTTDVLPGVDLVEVLDSEYRGLYVLGELVSDVVARLVTLQGQPAVFASDTSVTARLFRPVFSSAGRSGTEHAAQGVRVVGLPGDQNTPDGAARGALELVSGGRAGIESDVTTTGLRYALRTQVRPPDGSTHWGGSITADGCFEGHSFAHLVPGGEEGRGLSNGGFRFVPDAAASYSLGYTAFSADSAHSLYGIAIQSVETPLAGTFTGVDRIEVLRPDTGHGVGVGNLVQVLDGGGLELGIYRVAQVGFPYSELGRILLMRVILRRLDGSVPALPTSGSCTLQLLGGLLAGRTKSITLTIDGDPDATQPENVSAVEVSAPVGVDDGQVPVALRLVSGAFRGSPSYLIRGVSGDGETFSVKADGAVVANTIQCQEVEAMVAFSGKALALTGAITAASLAVSGTLTASGQAVADLFRYKQSYDRRTLVPLTTFRPAYTDAMPGGGSTLDGWFLVANENESILARAGLHWENGTNFVPGKVGRIITEFELPSGSKLVHIRLEVAGNVRVTCKRYRFDRPTSGSHHYDDLASYSHVGEIIGIASYNDADAGVITLPVDVGYSYMDNGIYRMTLAIDNLGTDINARVYWAETRWTDYGPINR